ncbi:MAG: CDP-alcohol phosphatidyltransferase [Gammaproteobacteria bacterium]|nr:MAG: CDP-alcohol phosphatidyltransferase [Gammaproteobacteria bacterium]RLA49157.1 MAG: CDP-alcohol phosphatidyltransferase [Gammaproteobacteria bacterium]
MSKVVINIPNILSGARLLLVPVLLVLADQQRETWFLVLLAVSLSTDAADGYLARKLNQTSELGAKLDSWGDALTYGAMVVALLWIWPDIFYREVWFVFTVMVCYLVPTALGFLKFHELPSFHTWSAKASAVAMVPAYYIMVLFDESALFRLVVIFDIWVALEAVFITVILNRNRNNVPTVFHAREIMRRQKARLKERHSQLREKIAGKKNDGA